MTWLILHVLAGHESHLIPWINYLGVETFQFTHTIKRRRRAPEALQTFPGYVFLRLGPYEPVASRIAGLTGVVRFLSCSERIPYAISDHTMDQLRMFHADKFAERPTKKPVPLAVGALLRILGGSFAGRNAVCDGQSGDTVRVSVELFGHNVRAELRRADVAVA